MGLDTDPEQPILFLMIDFSHLIDGVAGLALRDWLYRKCRQRHGLAFGLYLFDMYMYTTACGQVFNSNQSWLYV